MRRPASFLPAHRLVLVRAEPMALSDCHEAEVAAHWRAAVEHNPNLFNGPITSPLSAHVKDGLCVVRWCHSDFAHYLFSQQNRESSEATIGSLFVSVVVPITDGGFFVGRMSAQTSTPGIIQLPGGGVSISPDQTEMTLNDFAKAAAREVSEELGLALDPAKLLMAGVIMRHKPSDIGVVFLAEPYSWNLAKDTFEALRQAEVDTGTVSEFDELLAVTPGVDPIAELGQPKGHIVDYLPAVASAVMIACGKVDTNSSLDNRPHTS